MKSDTFDQSTNALNKTSTHIFDDTNSLLQSARKMASEARHIGDNRTKGYAAIVIFFISILLQGVGYFGLSLITPANAKMQKSPAAARLFTIAEQKLVDSNLARIINNVDAIAAVKSRVAPSMPIEQSLSSIRSAAEDLKTVISQSTK